MRAVRTFRCSPAGRVRRLIRCLAASLLKSPVCQERSPSSETASTWCVMAERMAVCIPRETVNDETVRILSWRIPSGSLVDEQQLVCEVETSKTVLEIHAPAAGRLEYEAS